jgi:enoyl-[acyl-carrier protein] reductase I
VVLLDGKRVLITGVLTDSSIAHSVARLAQEEGAEIVLTSFGRAMSLTERAARRLPKPVDVIELDVTNPAHLESVREQLSARWGALDGVLHAIGFAPESCLGGNFMSAGWDDVSVALHVSAYSLKALADLALPLMTAGGSGSGSSGSGGSIVGLDFDATVAWPQYDWMGVAKAAMESTSRYLARELGSSNVRVNLVSAGPLRTVAARSIPGFSKFEDVWGERAPLGWDVRNPEPAARACVALLSDWFPATTGEIVHVDGGFHAMGA